MIDGQENQHQLYMDLQIRLYPDREFIEEAFKANPNRLYHALDLSASRKQGLNCITPKCTSGSGTHGTGMMPYLNQDGYLRLKCFACGGHYSPFDLVMNVCGMPFKVASDYLDELYTPEHDERDDRPPVYSGPVYRGHAGEPLLPCEALTEVTTLAVRYNAGNKVWRERQAALLGLPSDALLRDDVGKSYVPLRPGVKNRFHDDGMDVHKGDLVFISFYQGEPVAIKVRHDGRVGYQGQISCYDAYAGRFQLYPCDKERDFRMRGQAGYVCFGHQHVTDKMDTIVITEGQTDTLAVDVALKDNGCANVVSVARDSASHILQETDLGVLAGKRVVYCEDPDPAGRKCTGENLRRLQDHVCQVVVWASPGDDVKDPRDMYVKYGSWELISSLLAPFNT